MKTETRNGNLSIIDHSSLPNSLLFDELLEEKTEQPIVFVWVFERQGVLNRFS